MYKQALFLLLCLFVCLLPGCTTAVSYILPYAVSADVNAGQTAENCSVPTFQLSITGLAMHPCVDASFTVWARDRQGAYKRAYTWHLSKGESVCYRHTLAEGRIRQWTKVECSELDDLPVTVPPSPHPASFRSEPGTANPKHPNAVLVPFP